MAGRRGPARPGAPKPGGPDPGFADDLRLAREARESIRALIGRNGGTEPLTADDLAPLEKVLGQAQPRLEVTADGRARLGPDPLPSRPRRWRTACSGCCSSSGTRRPTASWDRLKLCGNPDCRWAFYDRSHSRRGAWCDMASCGNRVKNRNLRARRAQAG